MQSGHYPSRSCSWKRAAKLLVKKWEMDEMSSGTEESEPTNEAEDSMDVDAVEWDVEE